MLGHSERAIGGLAMAFDVKKKAEKFLRGTASFTGVFIWKKKGKFMAALE